MLGLKPVLQNEANQSILRRLGNVSAVIGVIIIRNKLEDLCTAIEDVHSMMALDVKSLFQVIKLGDALLN